MLDIGYWTLVNGFIAHIPKTLFTARGAKESTTINTRAH
jgi:hypothetical protein